MFSGINKIPICGLISPRKWIQSRISQFKFRHDLSEDYTLFLTLLCSPDLPPLYLCDKIFCIISVRGQDTSTVTMSDRSPWVKNISLYLHDLIISSNLPGVNTIQLLQNRNLISTQATSNFYPSNNINSDTNSLRQITMLRNENEVLRQTIKSLTKSLSKIKK